MGVNRCSAFQVEALDSLEQGQQSDDSGTFSSNSTRANQNLMVEKLLCKLFVVYPPWN